MALDPNSYKKKTNRKSKNAKSQIIVDNKTHETNDTRNIHQACLQ